MKQSFIKAKSQIEPYLYLFPALFILLFMMVYPMIVVLRYSFFDNVIVNSSPKFVGLANYAQILSDPIYLQSILRTLTFTVFSVIFHLFLGLCFALLLNTNINPLVRAVLRAFYIMPWLFTATIVAIVWRLILNPVGVMNYLLNIFKIIKENIEWFSNVKTAMSALIFVNIWAGYPFYMVSLLAGLQGVSKDIYEAAIIDGANTMQRFWFVTLPHLIPIILSIALLDFIWTMQVFPLIWMTTGGGPVNATEVMSTFTYKLTFQRFEFSLASTSAIVILLISMCLSFFYVKKQKLE